VCGVSLSSINSFSSSSYEYMIRNDERETAMLDTGHSIDTGYCVAPRIFRFRFLERFLCFVLSFTNLHRHTAAAISPADC